MLYVSITEQIYVIQPEMLLNAVYNLQERLVISQQQNGGHAGFEHRKFHLSN